MKSTKTPSFPIEQSYNAHDAIIDILEPYLNNTKDLADKYKTSEEVLKYNLKNIINSLKGDRR